MKYFKHVKGNYIVHYTVDGAIVEKRFNAINEALKWCYSQCRREAITFNPKKKVRYLIHSALTYQGYMMELDSQADISITRINDLTRIVIAKNVIQWERSR